MVYPWRVILVSLCLLLAGCGSKTYRIKADSQVPAEAAAQISGKTFKEGRNLLVDFDTHKLYGVITNGEIASLTLEVQGEKPQTIDYIARMPDPTPTPPIETPMGCLQKCDVKLTNCDRACLGERCCLLTCWYQDMLCRHDCEKQHGGGIGGGGLVIM